MLHICFSKLSLYRLSMSFMPIISNWLKIFSPNCWRQSWMNLKEFRMHGGKYTWLGESHNKPPHFIRSLFQPHDAPSPRPRGRTHHLPGWVSSNVQHIHWFLIHLSLAESSGPYEMKIHLVWFADFLYSFVSTFKKVFFRSWPRSIDVSIWWSRMQQCKQYHVSLFWANMSINTSLG